MQVTPLGIPLHAYSLEPTLRRFVQPVVNAAIALTRIIFLIITISLIVYVIDFESCCIELSGHAFIDDKINRSEEHTSELQSLMRITYAVFFFVKHKILHNKN